MSRISTISIFVALALGFILPARAGTFNFSYQFVNDPHDSGLATATGTLTGTQIGDAITGCVIDVTIESLFVNGTQILGPILNSSSGLMYGGSSVGDSAVPFNLGLDADTDDYNIRFYSNDADGFFNVSHFNDGYWSDIGYTCVTAWTGPGNPIYNNDDHSPLWSLTAADTDTATVAEDSSTPVPEGSSTAALLCFALVSVVAIRRKVGTS